MAFANVLESIPAKKKLSSKKQGCNYCPLNLVPGINKVMGTVKGREVFVWGVSPGYRENKSGKAFSAEVEQYEFLWTELDRVGITRKMCDVQNVVRCMPATRNEDSFPALKMRPPTKEEIGCCSLYNREALEQSKAKLHLVFGEIAAKSLLGTEYKKGKNIFWSDRLQANVVCLYNPSYFTRDKKKSTEKYTDYKIDTKLMKFRSDLKYAAFLLGQESRYEYLEAMEYIGIDTEEMAEWAYKIIKKSADKGRRIATDIEDGILRDGRKAVLVCGFSDKPGRAFVFALDITKGIQITDEARALNWKIVKRILKDPEIKKVLHHGSSDDSTLNKLMKVKMEGFDYDTEFGEYFFDCDAKAYGLTKIADRRFPEFAGYKEVIFPEVVTKEFMATFPEDSKLTDGQKFNLARKRGGMNHALVPWNKIILYNGADCDLTKRIEVSTKKRASLPLMHIYRDAAFIMARMEKDGPLFDERHYLRLMDLYPIRVKRWRRKIRKIAGDPRFNPASTQQVVKLLYETLELEFPGEGKPNSQAATLEVLVAQHRVAQYILDFRRDAKLMSTYLEGFRRSAELHEGRITTRWWLTGTRTGRMSSGGSQAKKEDEGGNLLGIVNLQNIVSDAQLQNMLMSDPIWRIIYKYWQMNGDFTEQSWRKFEDAEVFLGFDQGQFEIRVVAQKSGDKRLIEVFERDEDIHAAVGFELGMGTKEEIAVEGPLRVAVKGMHFGIIYGLMARGLWVNICAEYRKRGIKPLPTLEWVTNMLNGYFEKYPKVTRMLEAYVKQAEAEGSVYTMFGFPIKINVQEQRDMGDDWKGAFWENQAKNGPIQGTAHQLMLIGLVPIIREATKYALLNRPQMEIHDAIYFLVKLKDIWSAIALGKEMLEKRALEIVKEDFDIEWKVPIKSEPKAGFRFGTQVYKLGEKKGPKTTAEFLNQWCKKNEEVEKKLKEEFQKLSL